MTEEIDYRGTKLEVEYDYCPEEKQTLEHQGCPAHIEVSDYRIISEEDGETEINVSELELWMIKNPKEL